MDSKDSPNDEKLKEKNPSHTTSDEPYSLSMNRYKNPHKKAATQRVYDTKQPTKKPASGFKKFLLFLLLLGLVYGLGWFSAHDFKLNFAQINNNPVAVRTKPEKDGNVAETESERNISSVAKKVSPSVVSIVTSREQMTYFGSREQQGAGTGVVVSKDGIILTNKHVVGEAEKFQVVMANGKTYTDIKLLGTDPLNDIAFIKIIGVNNLQAAELGDSSTVNGGQEVVAIGNALGQYQNTVTTGIISGTGRPVTAADQTGQNTETLTDLLQTDAAINPGNSGGPLLNLSGQVIGINTATASQAQGLGFAIPINATKGMLRGALANRQPQRAYLGVALIPITPQVAQENKLSVNEGAYVTSGDGRSAIVRDSAADRAGLKDKDVITKVNGVQVGSRGSVSTLIAEYSPGETVELTVLRNGSEQTFKATLQAYPDNISR